MMAELKLILILSVLCTITSARPRWVWFNEDNIDESSSPRMSKSREVDERKVLTKKEKCTTCDCCPVTNCYKVCVIR